jgi:hypothetical protein
MKQHGLLLSTPMAMARHAGRKTQTRRLITLHNSSIDGNGSRVPYSLDGATYADFDFSAAMIDRGPSPAGNAGPYLKVPLNWAGEKHHTRHRFYPRVQVGDHIWWKETWAPTESDGGPVIAYRAGGTMMHCATGDKRAGTWREYVVPGEAGAVYDVDRWKSSMLMPRWAARHVDTVTAVRPERLCAVTDADAQAEGVRHDPHHGSWYVDGLYQETFADTPRASYLKLMQHLHGEGIVQEDPWVWVYEWKL